MNARRSPHKSVADKNIYMYKKNQYRMESKVKNAVIKRYNSRSTMMREIGQSGTVEYRI